MTLKQLEAFFWAATSSNFLVAAERLHLSQSSLSKRIGELEASLGKTLFDRSRYRATVTDAGRDLLPLARQLLASASAVRDAMADTSGLSGHCRIGVGEQASLTWLPDLIGLARQTYPKLNLEPIVDVGSALEERIDAGLLDLAVVASQPQRPNLAGKSIGTLRFEWAASPTILRAGRPALAEALGDVPLITMPIGAGATRIVERWLDGAGFRPANRLTCNSMAAIAGLVVAGVGFSCFPAQWLQHMVKLGTVVRLDSRVALSPLEYFLQWRRDDHRPVVSHVSALVGRVADFSRSNVLWQAATPTPEFQEGHTE